MFNRTGFNRAAFNRPSDQSKLFEATLSADSAMQADESIIFSFRSAMSADSSQTALYIRGFTNQSAMSADSTISARYTRVVRFESDLSAGSSMVADNIFFRTFQLVYSGDFKPGDVIVIDSLRKTITLNGVNALRYMEGTFQEIFLGTNDLLYADGELNRNVRMRLTRKEKFN